MIITASRIKEIIREEYRRMNEAEAPLKYRAGSKFTYAPVEKGSKEEERAKDLVQATLGVYDEAPFTVLGTRDTGAGETEILVQYPPARGEKEGKKDVITIQKRQFKTDPDEDPEIERGRFNRPMLEESRETLKQFGKMAKGPEGKITARQAREMGLGGKLDRETDAAAVRDDLRMEEEAGDAAEDPATDELRTKAMEIFRNLSGVQQKERDMVDLLLNLIELAKSENINQQELRRRLGLAKDAAAKIAK